MEQRGRFGLRPVNASTPRGPPGPTSTPGSGASRIPRAWRPQGPPQTQGKPSRILKKEEKDELLRKLTPMQYRVTQEKLTERPYSNKYYKHWERGVYACVVCGEELFQSQTKYDAGSGWPSFYDIIDKDKVSLKQDLSHVGANLLLLVCNPSMARTEVSCSTCGAHVGHLFEDGPKPTGKRFCVNSAALEFRAQGSPARTATQDQKKTWSPPAEPVVHLASPSNSCSLGARMCFRVANMDACEAAPQQS